MGNKRYKLLLTGIGEVLKESAEKKLNTEEKTLKCDNGLTREQYEDLGVDIPKNLLEKEKIQDSELTLEDEDYEEVVSEVLVYEDQIKLMVEEDLTTLFLKGGITVNVEESISEIHSYIEYLHLSWFEKKYLLFLNFFRKKFGKKE